LEEIKTWGKRKNEGGRDKEHSPIFIHPRETQGKDEARGGGKKKTAKEYQYSLQPAREGKKGKKWPLMR